MTHTVMCETWYACLFRSTGHQTPSAFNWDHTLPDNLARFKLDSEEQLLHRRKERHCASFMKSRAKAALPAAVEMNKEIVEKKNSGLLDGAVVVQQGCALPPAGDAVMRVF